MNRALETVISAHTIKGTSFVGVRNYTSSKDEVSNQTILVGAEYSKAKLMDVESLREFDVTSYKSNFSEALLSDAKNKLIESLLNPGKAQSEGQKEAYDHVGPGLKVHKEKGELYVYGFVIAKTVITPGDYKHVNSKDLTLSKKELTKVVNLRSAKFRQFSLGKIETLKMNGFTL